MQAHPDTIEPQIPVAAEAFPAELQHEQQPKRPAPWRIALALLAIAAALTPSVWLAWQVRGMPRLGAFHDDGLYIKTA